MENNRCFRPGMETKKKWEGKNLTQTHPFPKYQLTSPSFGFSLELCHSSIPDMRSGLSHCNCLASVCLSIPHQTFLKSKIKTQKNLKNIKYFLADGVLALNPIPFVNNFDHFTKNKNVAPRHGDNIHTGLL